MAPHPTLTRRHLLVLPAAFLPLATVSGQATPQGSPVAGPLVNMRVATVLPEIPGALSDAHLSRSTLDPGAIIPAGYMNGVALLLVRSGRVTLSTDVPVTLRRAGDTGPARTTQVPPDGLQIEAGDGALVPVGLRMTLENTGGDVADVALLLITPLGNPTDPGEPAMTGVSTVGLGAAAIPFRSGPAITIVEHAVLEAGHSGYSATYKGVELGSVERGQARVLCQAGTTRVLPGPLTTSGVMEVEPGTTIDLGTGDGYTSHDGSLVWRAGPDELLVVLRAQVIPIPTAGR